MKITPLFNVALPAITVSLKERIDWLLDKGINVAIYASNFIPFHLKVENEGARDLFIVTFEKKITNVEAVATIELKPNYEEAGIEHVLAMIQDPRFNNSCPAIVCTGACFPPGTPWFIGGEQIVCVIPDDMSGHRLVLVPKTKVFEPGIAFLFVKKPEGKKE